MNEFELALKPFADVFATELQADAASVPESADVYAYAIMAPHDPGNLYIVSQIAKVSTFHSVMSSMSSMTDLAWWEKVLFAFTDRYTDPHWEDARCSFKASNSSLDAIMKQWFTEDRQAEWDKQLDQLYSTMLQTMHLIRSNSLVSKDCLLLIEFDDDEHRVTRRSFNELNSLLRFARLWPLYNLHFFFYAPIALTSNVLGNLIKRKRYG